jgi:para-nitrobenzyl esterase
VNDDIVAGDAGTATAPAGMGAGPVRLRSGLAVGYRHDGVDIFKGIPYAQPPIGPQRYRKPLPPEPWEGTRNCVDFGPHSLQGSARRGQDRAILTQSEDCLYLNVWSPGLDDAGRPVVVYVHGGGYVIGSGSEPFLSGEGFARCGVVFVTFNYRLAALGFLHLDQLFDGLEGTGNLGLYDTLRALEWVRDNIAALGGDASNVTLAGHSSGGVSTVALMGTPQAAGLFARAVPISSASGHSWIGSDAATAVARRVLDTAGVRMGDLDGLLATPAAQLGLSADLYNDLYDVAGGHPFEPVLDGDLITVPSIEAIRAGAGAGVDVLVGHMEEEFRLCVFDERGEVRDPPLNMGVTAAGFDWLRLLAHTRRTDEEVTAVYRRSLLEAGRDVTSPELFAQAASDLVMLNPGAALAEAHHGRTWMYRFAWRPPAGDGRVGACHGVDIPYFFGHLDAAFWAAMYQGQADARLAHTYQAAIVAMATTGRPGHDGLPAWPAYDVEDRSVMVFDTECRLVSDPDGERRRLFEGSPPYGYVRPG